MAWIPPFGYHSSGFRVLGATRKLKLLKGKPSSKNIAPSAMEQRGREEGEYENHLVGTGPEKLIHYVDKTMPDYEPESLLEKKAEARLKFISKVFTKSPNRSPCEINLPD